MCITLDVSISGISSKEVHFSNIPNILEQDEVLNDGNEEIEEQPENICPKSVHLLKSYKGTLVKE